MTLSSFLREWNDDSDVLLVHTSGSTGTPKPMYVEKRRMVASAQMTLRFLGLKPHDTALLCMPLDYIAGKMVVVRSLVGNLRLTDVGAVGHPLADGAAGDRSFDFAAMVPLQVYNSLSVEKERRRLMAIRHLIIGGGAVDKAVEAQLRDFPHAVWSTYGMTETLSHIAMRRISGSDASEWYTPLDGVTVGQDADQCLIINAPSVSANPVGTHDIVEFAPNGRDFKVIGRKDNVICCGGVKIQAEQVEELLRPHIRSPFMIGKTDDEKFGEIPVLVIESDDTQHLPELFARVLPKYWTPKKIVSVSALPLTETGKPIRSLKFEI